MCSTCRRGFGGQLAPLIPARRDQTARREPSYARVPHRRSHTLCSLPGEISLHVSKVAWRKPAFQQARCEVKNAKNKNCTVTGRGQHSLPVITLCFLMCLCYFCSVCHAGVQRSWLWQLLSLQCWWRVQGPDTQLIPGPSVWVWSL